MSDPSFDPEVLDLGVTLVGGTVAGSVTFDAGDQPGDYTVTVTGDGFASTSSTFSLAEDETATIPITLTPTAAGDQSGTLSLSGVGADRECALSGYAAEEPYVDGSIGALDLGTVVVGQSQLAPVVIQAPQTDDEDTTATVSVSGSGFSVSPSGSLTLGQVTTLVVTFEPTAAGEVAGELTVSWSRGSESGTLTVDLSGTGIEEEDVDEDTADGESSSSDAAQTSQRAVLYVPTYESLVALGKAYAPYGDTISKDGFTASTTRHVFLRAEKAVTAQANGYAWFQSTTDSLYCAAGGHAHLIAKDSVYVGSGGFVGVLAGFMGDTVDRGKDLSDANPDSPEYESDMVDGFVAATLGTAAFDLASTVGTGVKSFWEKWTLAGEYKKLGKKWYQWKRLQPTGQALFQVGRMLTAATAYTLGAIHTTTSGVALYGEAGLTMGTPSSISMLSTWGASFNSLQTTVLGHVTAEVEALAGTTTIDSLYGETTVRAGTTLSVLAFGVPAKLPVVPKLISKAAANDEASVDCSLGTVALMAPSVEIGDEVPDDLVQAPTLTVAYNALQSVVLETALLNVSKISLQTSRAAGVTKVSSKGAASFESALGATLQCGLFTIEATPTSILVKSPLGNVVELLPGGINLGPAAAKLSLLPGVANVASNTLMVSPGAIMTMAGRVDLL